MKMSKKSNNVQEVAEVQKVQTAQTAQIKEVKTPVDDRLYELANGIVGHSFKGKQRQITFNSLLSLNRPVTIKEISELAGEWGLIAKGGVIPSVRYHLHHLEKDGFVRITNPTTQLT
jgi:hypothetical protein